MATTTAAATTTSSINPWAMYQDSGVVTPSAATSVTMSSGGARRGTRFTLSPLVALSNVSQRGDVGGAAKRVRPYVCTMLVAADIGTALVPTASAQVEFSADRTQAVVEATQKDADDIKRNKETPGLKGPEAKVRRYHAAATKLERGSVITVVCMAESLTAKEIIVGGLYEVFVTEVDRSQYGGGSYEYQVSDIRYALGGGAATSSGVQKTCMVASLGASDYASCVTAAFEAVHNNRKPVPIAFAPGCAATQATAASAVPAPAAANAKVSKAVPLDKIDPRSRTMSAGDWVMPLRTIPPESIIERRAMGKSYAAVVVTGYNELSPDFWPGMRKTDNGMVPRDIIGIALGAQVSEPRVAIGAKQALPGAITPATAAQFYQPTVHANVSLTLWGEAIGGAMGIMDRSQWQYAVQPLFMGMPGIARGYCKRTNPMSHWPEDDTSVGFEVTAASNMVGGQIVSSDVVEWKSNNSVLAFHALGVVNAGYLTSHAAVLAVMAKLASNNPGMYAVNMRDVSQTDRGYLCNPMDTFRGTTGRARCFNVLECFLDLAGPGMDQYDYYVVPAHGRKWAALMRNNDTGAMDTQLSPALAWYTHKWNADGPDAAKAAIGDVVLAMIDNPTKVGVPQFDRPAAPANQEHPLPYQRRHTFLVFAVERAWAAELCLDPLRTDNERIVVSNFLKSNSRAPTRVATAAEIAAIVGDDAATATSASTAAPPPGTDDQAAAPEPAPSSGQQLTVTDYFADE